MVGKSSLVEEFWCSCGRGGKKEKVGSWRIRHLFVDKVGIMTTSVCGQRRVVDKPGPFCAAARRR